MTRQEVAQKIDLAVLRPDATCNDVLQGCEQARKWNVKSLVVLPFWLELIVRELEGSGVVPSTVIAFPFGAETTEVKVATAKWAVQVGAGELDMVMAIGRFKSGDYEFVRKDIEAVVKAAKRLNSDAIVKVIIETAYLTDDEKRKAAQIVEAAGADFVKTSTGFAPSGATVEDVRLLRQSVSEKVKVKAAGGIRTWEQAKALLEAGADRIGTSSAEAILIGCRGG
ncbi:MAG: deoxyribose-phosphate aldolase [Armatimonadetes bacterium]|nr:deoxyribose-phosphate aldolase [Armatimonadota bacterium]MDW8029460.1 deoxyribose-phosphate aldolase [Armatimonadota bacterium]